jgi:rhodanese-related sulfurtransferase
MDGNALSVSPSVLYARLGTASAPMLVDVRRQEAFSVDDKLIIGAYHRPPQDVSRWLNELSTGRPVVAYCSHGREVSQGVAASLRAAGIKAAYLEGGVSAWKEKKLPTRKNLDAGERNWVTREHPKIDRIACPWLISRFINPTAKFIYVPADQVSAEAAKMGAKSIRHQRCRVRSCGRSLFLRRDHPHLRYRGSRSRPSRDDRPWRRYVTS